MYTTITELPTQVTASLDDRDATVWMNTQNQAIPKNPTDQQVAECRRHAWEAVRTAPSSFSFCIKASVEEIDKDKEVIDVDSIKEHMDSFIKYGGNVQNEHGNYNVATIWGWDPIEEDGRPGLQVWGNIFGGDQVQDMARQAFLHGRNSLSVAGEASPGHFQCDEKGCYTRRNVKQLLEISLCDVPANPRATMLWYNQKAKITKSSSVLSSQDIHLNVDSYELHKDYTACPIQAIKKAMLDTGYTEVHAKPEGVVMKMSQADAKNAMSDLMYRGYLVNQVPEGLYVQSPEKLREFVFKKAYNDKAIDGMGRITKSISKKDFQYMWDMGWIHDLGNGEYWLGF